MAACIRKEPDPLPLLVLLRHAKSSYPTGVRDDARPLSDRGRRDAVAAGEWISSACGPIDEAVISPAKRARETWALAAPSLQVRRVRTDDRIYDDWGSRLGDVLADVDAGARSALILGHNPGIEEFALSLVSEGRRDDLDRMREKFPTSAVAVLELDGCWGSPGPARLVAFAVPRG